MSELSKQATELVGHAQVELSRQAEQHGWPFMLADQIALGQAVATVALVQATEAQTKAVEQQTEILKKIGNRR